MSVGAEIAEIALSKFAKRGLKPKKRPKLLLTSQTSVVSIAA